MKKKLVALFSFLALVAARGADLSTTSQFAPALQDKAKPTVKVAGSGSSADTPILGKRLIKTANFLELVGIMGWKQQKEVWWRQDGSQLNTGPIGLSQMNLPSGSRTDSSLVFLFDLKSPSKAAGSHRFTLSEPRATSAEIAINDPRGQRLSTMIGLFCLFPKDPAKEVDVHIGFDSGPPRILASWDAGHTMPIEYKGGGVVFHQPREEDGSLVIYSACTDYTPWGETWLTLFDHNGKRHEGIGSTSARSAGFISAETRFAKLHRKDVKSVELRAKFYDWEIFRHVSLQAGHRTSPERHTLSSSNLLADAPALALRHQAALADSQAQTKQVRVGAVAPDFACRTLSGDEFSLSRERGKVVLVNFFATWCGPCLTEMPHLEKEIFQKYAGRKDFKLIAIGREHGASELEKFKKEKRLTLPMAPDLKREIYSKYAEEDIPRNFIIGKDGKVKLAVTGYSEEDFREIVQTIQDELEK